jgi:hypothetical protein
MNPSPTKSAAGHAAAGDHASAPKEPDDPAWNPGKPLSDIMNFLDFED